MTNSEIEFAPVGVFRAAAWSIESLDLFGSRELARLSLSATTESLRQEYLTTYDRVFQQERQQLWKMTAADERFMKALYLSNSIVAQKAREYLALWQQHSYNKTIRRLENTLYRYLARAVGRTTPNGLWAGVGLVRFTQTQTSVATQLSASQYSFTPDLRPFQAILRGLSGRSTYRNKSNWQINPTVQLNPSGNWQFGARMETGALQRCEITRTPSVDFILTQLIKLAPMRLVEIVGRIQAVPDCIQVIGLSDNVYALLNDLIDAGVLLGGLDLPQQFETVWQALTTVSQQLVPDDSLLWDETVAQLQSLCTELAANLEKIAIEELEYCLQLARHSIIELAQGLEVQLGELPEPILHCDLGLPFEVHLSPAHHRFLLNTLESYDGDWLKGISPSMALRRKQRQQLQQQLTSKLPLGTIAFQADLQADWRFLQTHSSPDFTSEIANCLQIWESLLSSAESDVAIQPNTQASHDLSATAPLGCLYVFPHQDFQLVVVGVDDDPARAFTRFGRILDRENELHTWLQQQLQEIASQHGLQFAELQVPFESNPNVLARGKFLDLGINLWSVDQNGTYLNNHIGLNDASLGLDSITQLPVVHIPSRLKPLVILWFSAANIAANDPIADFLLYTGFQERPIYVPASSMPKAIELSQPMYSPRIHLANGAVIQPRRTVLSGERLQDLIQSLPPDRYLKWQALAVQYGWSELLNIQVDYEPPLLGRRDSPLMLQAIFKSVDETSEWIIVEEVEYVPWLVDEHNRHYFTELALPFQRSQHGWSPRSLPYLSLKT